MEIQKKKREQKLKDIQFFQGLEAPPVLLQYKDYAQKFGWMAKEMKDHSSNVFGILNFSLLT